MNELDRRINLYHRHKELTTGAPIRRLILAKGYSADHGVWEMAVVEYLASGVGSEEFIGHMLHGELPARCVRRQVELIVGLQMTALPCPVRIDARHVVISAIGEALEGDHA